MEVIPGLLSWDPGKGAAVGSVDGLSLCGGEGAEQRGYHVTHYAKEACGVAFGPLNLENTIQFCRALAKRLEKHAKQEQPLVLTSASRDAAAHTNLAVLLGAYLILQLGRCVESVVCLLGAATAERRIPCSWAKSDSQDAVMKVLHCWLGFEAARNHGWMAAACLSDDFAADLFCSQYQHMVRTYDACWVVPGKLLICADPITTAADPNPCTFSDLFGSYATSVSPISPISPGIDSLAFGRGISPPSSPTLRQSAERRNTNKASSNAKAGDIPTLSSLVRKEKPMALRSKCVQDQSTSNVAVESPIISVTAFSKTELGDLSMPELKDDEGLFNRDYSTATVCKDYAYSADVGQVQAKGQEALPFCDFLRKHLVSVVVRANFQREPGMVTNSYDAKKLQEHGIDHVNLPFPDWGEEGAVPPVSVCQELLALMKGHLVSQGAICVHCKGGFGRSAMFLCILAIHHYDVSGEAMLGWIRVVRPGAITSTQQEEFLCALQGRRSLQNLLKQQKPKQQSVSCCALQ
eukprot:TRINITY_DN4968_c0_g1_i1.p1 TRINITY_DN4968_c0_g1~~TRINITY_DN4968_c0_g1_i1.p1  ORF type:complete len:521 (-),score=80.13 TRINITY_DN4968_c0_g1_i1:102-1664(-)